MFRVYPGSLAGDGLNVTWPAVSFTTAGMQCDGVIRSSSHRLAEFVGDGLSAEQWWPSCTGISFEFSRLSKICSVATNAS